MTRDERYELLAKQREAYGFPKLIPKRYSSRTVFIAPFLEREFFFICRINDVGRRDAKRMWAILQFISKADNIGPDEKSLEMIRNGTPEVAHLSDGILRDCLRKLAEMHFTYETHTSYKPWAPDPNEKTDAESPEKIDWKSRALLAESKLSSIYSTVANTIHRKQVDDR